MHQVMTSCTDHVEKSSSVILLGRCLEVPARIILLGLGTVYLLHKYVCMHSGDGGLCVLVCSCASGMGRVANTDMKALL